MASDSYSGCDMPNQKQCWIEHSCQLMSVHIEQGWDYCIILMT